MAYTVQQLIDNPELIDKLALEREIKHQEDLADEYWEKIGELVEEHPVPGGKVLRRQLIIGNKIWMMQQN